MHGSKRKIPSKKSRPYIYVKFLALLGAPYIYDISRLRVKERVELYINCPSGLSWPVYSVNFLKTIVSFHCPSFIRRTLNDTEALYLSACFIYRPINKILMKFDLKYVQRTLTVDHCILRT
jgi:hypothetical protein